MSKNFVFILLSKSLQLKLNMNLSDKTDEKTLFTRSVVTFTVIETTCFVSVSILRVWKALVTQIIHFRYFIAKDK